MYDAPVVVFLLGIALLLALAAAILPYFGGKKWTDGGNRYTDPTSGISFLYPSGFEPHYLYPDDLVPSVSSIDTEVIAGDITSPSDYVDSFAIHFPGPFQVERPVHSTAYGRVAGTEKSFVYGEGQGQSLSRRRVVFMTPNAARTQYLILEIDGNNTRQFDRLVEEILSTITP